MTQSRHLLGLATLLFALATTSTPANARDIDIGKLSYEDVKAFCSDARNVKYLEGMGVYGCKWIGDAGSFAVICDKTGCLYSTPVQRQVVRRRNVLRDIARGRLR